MPESEGRMANSYRSADVQCPFYIRDENRRIVCEGFVPRANAGFWFETNKAQLDHMETFCMSKWQSCPYADTVNRRYED